MSNWDRVRVRIETKQDLNEAISSELAQEPGDGRTLSTHILDTSIGRAAQNVPVSVFILESGNWKPITQAITNEDGRVGRLLSVEQFQSGFYKLSFDVRQYFESNKVKSFYPFIEVIVECERGQHYHVPLLLNPFGYSTYRGT